MIDLKAWEEMWRKRRIVWRREGGEVRGVLLGCSHERDKAIIAVPTGKKYPPSEIVQADPKEIDFAS